MTLCIHPSLNDHQSKYPDFQTYDGKGCPYAHLRLYGIAMAQLWNDDKLSIHTSPESLKGPTFFTWFTKIEMSKIKLLADLVWLFKPITETPDKEQLQKI